MTDTKKDAAIGIKNTDVKAQSNQVPTFSSDKPTNTVPTVAPVSPKEVTTSPKVAVQLTPSQHWMKEVNEIALMSDAKEAATRLTDLIKVTASTYSNEIASGRLVLIDKDTSAHEDILRFVSLCSLLVTQRVVQLKARKRGYELGPMTQLVTSPTSFRNPVLNKITAETIRNLV